MRLTPAQVKEVEKDIKDGWILKIDHPDLPLSILSYSRQTQYEYNWTFVRMLCRGLIVDNNWNFVALPFVKFFSYEEIPAILEKKKHRIFEKVDGSMIIAFFYEDKFITTTLRSWKSEHSVKAKKLFLTKYADFFKEMRKDRTYLLEFVSPDHKIVLDYKEDQLFLLGITNPSLKEECLDEYDNIASIQKPREFKGNVKTLLRKDVKDMEGFILRYEDGTRFKAKYEAYVKAHRFVFGMTPKKVWESMKDGNISELIALCPDELDNELNNLISHFEKRYDDVYNNLIRSYDELKEMYSEALFKEDDKYFATIISMHPSLLKPLLFAYNKGKHQLVEEIIWKQIKPKRKE